MNEPEDTGPKPDRKRTRKVSVFALAAESQTVDAEIDVADVLQFRPTWTPQQAAQFLRDHSELIGTAMVVRGVEMLASIVGEDPHVN